MQGEEAGYKRYQLRSKAHFKRYLNIEWTILKSEWPWILAGALMQCMLAICSWIYLSLAN